MSAATKTEPSSAAERRPSTSSTSSLPEPLQKLVDEAEKDREVYEEPYSRIPRPFRIFGRLSRPGKVQETQGRQQRRQQEQQQQQQRDQEQTTKETQTASEESQLPATLQRLVDKEEREARVYEDPWGRISAALGLGRSNKKFVIKP